jgi:vacuolar-type H+-ATPase subunit H
MKSIIQLAESILNAVTLEEAKNLANQILMEATSSQEKCRSFAEDILSQHTFEELLDMLARKTVDRDYTRIYHLTAAEYRNILADTLIKRL